jgi:hemoglobin/transferrin/lactoferrin receptor protein
MRLTPIAIALQLALTGTASANQQVNNTADNHHTQTPQVLDKVSVIATRSASVESEVPASVSLIDRKQIDHEQSFNLKDLLRYQPGVSVSQAYGRFGIGDVRIRGIGGNRVQLQIDGVDVSDAFSIGSFSNAGRDFVDPEILEQVEILRGPSSALYGSDALGGIVQMRTREPRRLLGPEDNWAARGKLQAGTEDNAFAASAMFAAGSDQWSSFLQLHRRRASERDNFGENTSADRNRTAPNPQEIKANNLVGKLQRDIGDQWKLIFNADLSDSTTNTDVLSGQGLQTLFGTNILTRSLQADDDARRQRYAFSVQGGDLNRRLFDEFDAKLYRQQSETTQYTREERATVVGGLQINPSRRERLFDFDQTVEGVELLMRKQAGSSTASIDLHYGLSLKQTHTNQQRDGLSTNLTTGAISNTISPDVFPVRDFPLSETRELGLFMQSELRLIDERLRITPALRWDKYKLSPQLDTIFAADNPGITPVQIQTEEFSPKLSAAWHFNDKVMTYITAAEGFRAPPYNDANIGFTNFAFGYTAIPNPNLQAETSIGLEWGLKAAGSVGELSIAAYNNRYDNFIESLRAIGTDPATGLLVFQSQNVREVRIRGWELAASLRGEQWNLPGWQARFAYSHATGDDLSSNTPLNSVDPDRVVLGLGYQSNAWGLELVSSAAARKKRVAPLSGNLAAFTPPGYAVFDVLANFAIGNNTRIHVGLMNVCDRKYWDWADVPSIAASSTTLDRYTRPGRSVRLSLSASF